MSKFTIYDSANKPQWSMSCPDDQDQNQVAPPGMRLVKGEPPPSPVSAPMPPEPDYVRKRREEYPSVTAQLEMLWDAMDASTMTRSEPFYSVIKAVKLRNPKVVAPDQGSSVVL